MKELCGHLEDMLSYKESLGYSRKTYEGFLNDFTSYLRTYHTGAARLTEDMALDWCVKRETEKESGCNCIKGIHEISLCCWGK